ncbi:MAG: N-acetylmuramoyl-L-alanine amidase [Acetobacter sp.]|nr:N-acetylmuramoyl-L-alanine amidase [Acetobacter sp.]
MRDLLLPYYNERRKDYIDTLVIHAAAQHTVSDLVGVLANRELSAHYVIGVDGDVVRLVPDEYRAWHAGAGEWNGERQDINSNSIGIELCNGLFGEMAYAPKQIEALTELCLHLIDKYDFQSTQIIGHSDMAPTRKIDPGSKLPWAQLAKDGVGLWYDMADAKKVRTTDVRKLLSSIGYGVENQEASEWAFLRRFNPELYFALGGKKGANSASINGAALKDNIEFVRTLQAVSAAFAISRGEGKMMLPVKEIANLGRSF